MLNPEAFYVYLVATSRLSISLCAFNLYFEFCIFRCAISPLVIGVCLVRCCRGRPGLVRCLLRSNSLNILHPATQPRHFIQCFVFSLMVRVNYIAVRFV